MHEVLVNRLGGLSLPRKSVVRLTDRPDMTLDVYRGRKKNNATTTTTILLNHGVGEELNKPLASVQILLLFYTICNMCI